MVAAMVGQVVVGLGAVLAVVGLIFGGLLVTSDDFVIARIQCNETDPNYAANASFCNEDGFATEQNGDVCQVGNLGVYSAAFTPDCLDGTPYAIPPELTRGGVAPTEFGLLFPAQTGLAGLTEAFLNTTDFPEFESCESYFSTDNEVLNTVITTATFVGLDESFDALAESVKESYDEGLDLYFALINGIFANSLSVAESTLSGCNALVFAATGNVSTIEDLYVGGGSTAAGLAGALGTIISGFTGGSEPADTQIATLQACQGAAASAGVDGPDGATIIQAGFAVGVPSQATSGSPALVTGVADEGLWAPFDSTVLCALTGGECTYLEVFQGQKLSLEAAGLTTAPNFKDAYALLSLLVDTLEGYQTQVLGGLTLQAAALDPAIDLSGLDQSALQDMVQFIYDGATTIPASLTPEFEAYCNAVGSGAATSEQNMEGAVNLLIAGGIGTDALLTNLKSQLVASDEDPATYAIPADFVAAGDSQVPAFGLVCAGVGLLPDCSFKDVMDASLVIASTPATLDLEAAEQLTVVTVLLDACETALITTVTTCLGFAGSGTGAVAFPGPSADDFFTFGASGLFSQLYSAVTNESTIEELYATLIDACEDDEIDKAAIEQAQTFIPAGIALIGTGLAIAVFNLVVKNKATKVIGAVAGVIALIGCVLIILALLGIFNAPIYDSVGSSGPVEDGDQLFSLGGAYTFALGLVVAGAIGAVLLLVGGALTSPPDESAEILSAKS